MTRNQTELFKNASAITEGKIRQARAMQAEETRNMVGQAMRALVARFRRSKETSRRNAEA